jgi:hypothetical protein
MTWASGIGTGPERPGDLGQAGITVILAYAAPATGNGMSIQLPTGQTTYVATGNGDPKSGTVSFTGPDNGWYTFSGTIAEEVRSEATGLIMPGVDGPLHQFTVKIQCANHGQP